MPRGLYTALFKYINFFNDAAVTFCNFQNSKNKLMLYRILDKPIIVMCTSKIGNPQNN